MSQKNWSEIAANFPQPFIVLDIGAITIARGVNYKGVVVGRCDSHAFRWNPNVPNKVAALDTFDFPPDLIPDGAPVLSTVATGINDDGIIVGFCQTKNGAYGFVLDPFPFDADNEGTYEPRTKKIPSDAFFLVDLNEFPNLDADGKDLKAQAEAAAAAGDPIILGTHVQCVNDDLTIGGRVFVGEPKFPTSATAVHGFLLTGWLDKFKRWQTYKSVVLSKEGVTEIYGVNNHNDIVGVTSLNTADPGQGFMQTDALQNPSVKMVGFPGAFFSRAMGITSGKKIVGQCTFTRDLENAAGADGYGYMWDTVSVPAPAEILLWMPPDGHFARSTYAHGINDNSVTVGTFRDTPEKQYGFVLFPLLWHQWQALGQLSRWAEKVPTVSARSSSIFR